MSVKCKVTSEVTMRSVKGVLSQLVPSASHKELYGEQKEGVDADNQGTGWSGTLGTECLSVRHCMKFILIQPLFYNTFTISL